MRERKESIIVRATVSERQLWEEMALRVRRDLPAYLTFSGNAMARYLLERDHMRRPDYVLIRQEEKRKLGALLKASRAVVEHVPKVYHCPIRGPLHLQGPLRKALEELSRWLAWHGEEYPCD
jgi:hypothetical protein